MKKKWIAEFIALAISASAITPLEAQDSLLLNPGQQIVAEVDASYRKGEYDIFLEQLHQQYESAGKAGVLRGVFESSKAASNANAKSVEDKSEELRSKMQKLTQERNSRLLEAIAADSSTAIAKKVDAIVFHNMPLEYGQVLAELDQLKYHMPDTDEGTVENKISALETEYYIKSLLLDIASHQASEESQDLPKKKIALSLEKLNKMEDIAKEKNDANWLKKIELAKEANSAEKSFRVDFESLQRLAFGKIQPENSVEQKVKEIMMDYLQQKDVNLDNHINEIAQK